MYVSYLCAFTMARRARLFTYVSEVAHRVLTSEESDKPLTAARKEAIRYGFLSLRSVWPRITDLQLRMI